MSTNTRFCETCCETVNARSYTGHCNSLKHKNKLCPDSKNIYLMKSAFKGRIRSYRICPAIVTNSLQDFRRDVEENMIKSLHDTFAELKMFKVSFELFGLYYLPSKNETAIKSFGTKNVRLCSVDNISEILQSSFHCLESKMTEFSEKDSGWILVQIMFIEINVSKYCIV